MTQSFGLPPPVPAGAVGALGSSGAYTAAYQAQFAGTITDINDILGALLELRWKEVSIPYIHLRTELRQDLAIHKFADRDGAHIEGTGRHPLQISARIPFLVGLQPGKNELFQKPLYPFTFRKFFSVCADRRSGTLQHPEFGDLTCKLESLVVDWDGNVRAGVFAEAVWLESDDSTVELDNDLATPSPLADMAAAAADIDVQLTELDPSVIPQLPVFGFSFTGLANSIRGAVDQVTILQKQFAGRIDNMIYQCNQLETSLSLVSNAVNWPIVESCERAKSSCYDLKKTLLTKGKPIAFWLVQKDSTMAQITAQLGASLSDLMVLNPALFASPLVFAGSVVRYYRAAA